MCGIAGLIRPTLLSDVDFQAVRNMTSAMFHRGPDGQGEFIQGITGKSSERHSRLFMAMRRLSIVDLQGGWQPLYNEDRSIVVIANGEIYNHVELRAELLARGHVLHTGSDCEVLTHLYEDHGLNFVDKLRGMFAFALWDSKQQRLILGRDRMGEKCLYLHVSDEQVWFASELKALLASTKIPFSLDPAGIHSYMHYGWIPEPLTAVVGIHKLQPGHLLIIDQQPWSVREHCYWRIEDARAITGDPVELLREELQTVGKQIVRADVPIGIALSGGFDSSLTAAIAVRHCNQNIKAFTVGYVGSPGQDERDDAREFAADLGMQHHSIEIASSDMVAAFPKLAFDRDDPIADIAGYGYYVLSERARDAGCPVLLQGQGADELLWGYPWASQAVRHSLRKFSGNPVSRLEALWAHRPSGISRPQMVRLAYVLGGLLSGWRALSPGYTSPDDQLVAYDLTDPYQIGAAAACSTYSQKFAERVRHTNAMPEEFFQLNNDGNRTDIQLIALLCRGYLLQNGLAQGDRLAMANSVELRLPLVDYRLAELLVGVQKTSALYSARPKSLLHEAARDLLPDYVAKRVKRGFNPPVAEWIQSLRIAYGHELVDGVLVANDVLDRRAALKLSAPQSRFGVGNDLFMKYLVLEYWYRGMQAIATQSRLVSKPTARVRIA